jgi:hypothetical protein
MIFFTIGQGTELMTWRGGWWQSQLKALGDMIENRAVARVLVSGFVDDVDELAHRLFSLTMVIG